MFIPIICKNNPEIIYTVGRSDKCDVLIKDKMLSRVIGEFETQELAELAIMRIRESVGSIYSASTIQSKISANANSLTHGTSYTVLPTAFNTRTNFMSAVMESPVYADDVPEPYRRTHKHNSLHRMRKRLCW